MTPVQKHIFARTMRHRTKSAFIKIGDEPSVVCSKARKHLRHGIRQTIKSKPDAAHTRSHTCVGSHRDRIRHKPRQTGSNSVDSGLIGLITMALIAAGCVGLMPNGGNSPLSSVSSGSHHRTVSAIKAKKISKISNYHNILSYHKCKSSDLTPQTTNDINEFCTTIFMKQNLSGGNDLYCLLYAMNHVLKPQYAVSKQQLDNIQQRLCELEQINAIGHDQHSSLVDYFHANGNYDYFVLEMYLLDNDIPYEDLLRTRPVVDQNEKSYTPITINNITTRLNGNNMLGLVLLNWNTVNGNGHFTAIRHIRGDVYLYVDSLGTIIVIRQADIAAFVLQKNYERVTVVYGKRP